MEVKALERYFDLCALYDLKITNRPARFMYNTHRLIMLDTCAK